jgi:hypothetical protein
MDLDVAVRREEQDTRVVIQGRASLGQLCSLLRVLEVDSATWPQGEVRLDLRQVQSRFAPAEEALLRQVVECRLRSRRVALLWPPGAGGGAQTAASA